MFLKDHKMLERLDQRSTTLFWWLIILSFPIGVIMAQKEISSDTKTEAEKVWEIAIKAKGGRERLYEIESIQESSTKDSRSSDGKKYVTRSEALIVLPNKVWVYADESGSVFGITQSMLNYEDMTGYFGQKNSSNTITEPLSSHERKLKAYQNSTILYLLESKWLKPHVIGVKPGKVDGTDVQIVETRIDGRRVDVAFDLKTFLPTQIEFYDTGFDGGPRLNTARLWNYTEVDGIKVPQAMTYSGTISKGGVEKMTIRFNVEYDPDIFLKPPAKLTPEAWKKKP